MEMGGIYFWTATINQWKKLLWPDRYKEVIIDSLTYLTNKGKIDVFGFVIMPNHLHLIWRINEPNGKEMPQGSFLKYTAHRFLEMLFVEDKNKLLSYRVVRDDKKHEFWQRDPLAVPLYSRTVAFQKLDYIHYNPLAGRWRLTKDPCEYRYSSARFYEDGTNRFGFLRDLRDEF